MGTIELTADQLLEHKDDAWPTEVVNVVFTALTLLAMNAQDDHGSQEMLIKVTKAAAAKAA